MYILASNCETYAFIQVIYLIKVLLQIAGIAVPILLIVLLTIKFVKAITASEDEMKKAVNGAIKSVISAVVIFFIPSIVGLVMNMLGNSDFKVAACWNEATKENVARVKKVEAINRVKASTDRIRETVEENIELYGDILDDEDKNEIDEILNKLDESINDLNVSAATKYKNELQKKSDSITKIIKEYRWKEIMEKAPKFAESTGGSTDGIKFIMNLEGNEGYCNNGSGYLAKNIGDGTVTVGYGVTNYDQAIAISLGYGQYFPMNDGDCLSIGIVDSIFESTLQSHYSSVNATLQKYNVTGWKQNQIDALVAFSYNYPAGVDKAISNYASGGQDAMWSYMKQIYHCGGTMDCEAGLKKRRAMEWELFQFGNYNVVSNDSIASKYY